MSLNRRDFLKAAGAMAPFALVADRLRGESPAIPPRIIRMRSPENLESNFAALDGFRTPTASFYVRNHFAAPKIDANKWRLRVEGAVDRPLELTMAELRKLQTKTMPLTLECAGNGRVFLTPAARGVNWELGAVGTAEWTGVPLAEVVNRAGTKPGAAEVILEGPDSGAPEGAPGPITFARSLPLCKAARPEVLLAFGMNNQDLPAEHGFPLRAVVGGWYGMASVKWLTNIRVVEKPFQGFWQTMDYAYFDRTNGLPALAPITAMQVKSQIARPTLGEVLPARKPYRIKGAAWAGEADVAKVEVSVDAGKTWHDAQLSAEKAPFCWRLWECDWPSPRPGKTTLLARATDSKGRLQPTERNSDFRNYMIHHVLPVDVEVR